MEPFYESSRDFKSNCFQLIPFENMDFPAHLHNTVEILFLKTGLMTVTINNEKSSVSASNIVILLPDDIHRYETVKNSSGVMMIFSDTYLYDFRKFFGDRTIKDHVFDEIAFDIDSFTSTYEGMENNYLRNLFLSGSLNTLFFKLLQRTFLINKADDKMDILRKILLYTAREFDKGINQNDAAEYLGLSRTCLSRILNQKIGCSFNVYLSRLRIEKAKRLLLEGNMTILDVALECGFDNQRTFNRVFRKYEQATPTDYRKSEGRKS